MASGKQSAFDLLWGNSEPLKSGFNLDNIRNAGIYAVNQAKGAPVDDIDYVVTIYSSLASNNKRATIQTAYSTGGAVSSRVHQPTSGWTPWVSLAVGGGGVGTVTSVQVSGGTTGLTAAGGPVVGSGTITLGGTLAVASGGTGAINAATARTNLGLVIGTNVHPFSPFLSALTLQAYADGDILYSDGTNLVAINKGVAGQILQTNATGAPTWRDEDTGGAGTVTSIGMVSTTGLTFAGGPVTTAGNITMSGVLALSNGGTGAATAVLARAGLGLAIGTNVQAFHAILSNLSTTFAQGDVLYYNGTNMVPLSAGVAGQFLTTQGNGANPSWTTQVAGGAGTVTSVDGSGGTTGLTLTGGPITSTGALTLGGTLALANGGTGATTSIAAFTALKQNATTIATGVVELTTATEWRDNTPGKALTTDSVWDAMAEVVLPYASPVSWNMSIGIDLVLTLTNNAGMENPTNVIVGKKGRLRIVQDGTGGRTVGWGVNFDFPGGNGVNFALTTAANAEDILYYDCISPTRILITMGAANVG